MYAGRFEFGMFNGPHDPRDAALSMRIIQHGCNFLYKVDEEYCLAYGRSAVPYLYSTRRDQYGRQTPLVIYKTPESACGGDVWRDIPMLVGRSDIGLVGTHAGDCKDLACYLAAYRTVFEKIPSRPVVRRRWFDNGFALYHVIVQNLIDGSFEDPSLMLGMPPALSA